MKNQGFSLVELSIVLVILGLLTGGILAGQNLIRAAELRNVATEYDRYIAATNTFRDKYFAIPGDMRNAEDFWGTMATGACPNATAGTGTQTCNGDGDGFIDINTAGRSSETMQFWKQLANAGLIEGSYTGTNGAGSSFHAIIGVNSPASKISTATWYVRDLNSTLTGNASWYDNTYRNHFMYGIQTTNTVPQNAVLTPEEAWNVDTKMDDGKPGTGTLIAFNPSGWNNGAGTLARCTLSTSGADKSADYALSQTAKLCTLLLMNPF